MDILAIIYFSLAVSYLDAALQSFSEHKRHCGFREVIIAALYASITFLIF